MENDKIKMLLDVLKSDPKVTIPELSQKARRSKKAEINSNLKVR